MSTDSERAGIEEAGGAVRPATVELTRRLLEETRDEIDRADNKASIVLTGAGIALGALLGAFIYGAVSLGGQPGAVLAGVVASALLVGSGLVVMASIIVPRTGQALPGRARYYRDVVQYGGDVDRLGEALAAEAAEPHRREREQLVALAEIVSRKYARMRVAMGLCGAGLAAALLTGVAAATLAG